jgi:hypothetical protein
LATGSAGSNEIEPSNCHLPRCVLRITHWVCRTICSATTHGPCPRWATDRMTAHARMYTMHKWCPQQEMIRTPCTAVLKEYITNTFVPSDTELCGAVDLSAVPPQGERTQGSS